MKTHWFPLIKPAIRAGYFLGGMALGGLGPLGSHEDIHNSLTAMYPDSRDSLMFG